MLIFCWLVGLSVLDIRYKKVPVWLLLVGGMVTAGVEICACVVGENNLMNFFAGMIPGMILLLMAIGTQKAGWADGIVLMLLGSVLGFRQCVLATMFSLVLISVLSVILLILKKADKKTTVPYIPFLTAGVILCKFIGI